MATVLVLQHVDCEGLGYFEEPLTDAGIKIKTVHLYQDDKIPDIADYSALIVLGGYMNVYEEDKFSFLKDDDAAIRKAVRLKIPYLGVCLGAQLLAKALDAKVYKNFVKEIGFYNVELTGDGKSSVLFSGLPSDLKVFQWHGDTFDLPVGAELLATSKLCTHQAFSYGNAYGLQFHLETTPEMISEWNRLYKDELKEFDSSLVLEPGKATGTKQYGETVFKNFMKLF